MSIIKKLEKRFLGDVELPPVAASIKVRLASQTQERGGQTAKALDCASAHTVSV
jgi:hypothetical protein